MLIKKVIEKKEDGQIGYEVIVEYDGKEYRECFDGEEWMKNNKNGKPKFIERIKENMKKRKEKESNTESEIEKKELKEFQGMKL